jgi:hypothetical protein
MPKQHSYSRDTMVLERDVVHLYADVTIGSSGAVTTAKGGALTSVTKEATAGQYSIVLDSGFNKLLHVSVQVVGSSASGVASVDVLQSASSVLTNLKAGAALKIQCYDYAGSAVNPASGSVLKVKFEVRRTTVGPFD